MQACVYIVTNKRHGVIYTGVTSNLVKRIWQHKNKATDGFTKQYNLEKLVYFEITSDMRAAISREKQLKNWKRQWKIELVDSFNPGWVDLYESII